MSTEIELFVRQMFDNFDRLDFAAMSEQLATDAQGVDEISRRWLRSEEEISKYFVDLGHAVSQVRSQPKDLHEVTWGDTAVVTLWVDQSYLLEGQPQQVSAPTTIVLRRESGSWKVALIHSVPLPEQE